MKYTKALCLTRRAIPPTCPGVRIKLLKRVLLTTKYWDGVLQQ